mmetsp:Transcript_55978/g.121858  ORF Transcript_55978/g.121858 Transcript_55978/m.121858 type:complete len:235 (-) Transcript_55978:518-1222(-)
MRERDPHPYSPKLRNSCEDAGLGVAVALAAKKRRFHSDEPFRRWEQEESAQHRMNLFSGAVHKASQSIPKLFEAFEASSSVSKHPVDATRPHRPARQPAPVVRRSCYSSHSVLSLPKPPIMRFSRSMSASVAPGCGPASASPSSSASALPPGRSRTAAPPDGGGGGDGGGGALGPSSELPVSVALSRLLSEASRSASSATPSSMPVNSLETRSSRSVSFLILSSSSRSSRTVSI